MGSGRYLNSHRPMWPEWKDKSYATKRFLFYERGRLYENDGRLVREYGEYGRYNIESSNYHSFASDLCIQPSLCFTENLASPENLLLIASAASDRTASVLCNQRGQPWAIRMQPHQSSSWMVQWDKWFSKEEIEKYDDKDRLCILSAFFDYIGLGSAPTPSSLGRKTMRYIWQLYHLSRHTSPPLACEKYLYQNGFGGMDWTKYTAIGNTFDISTEIDAKMKYVSELTYGESPDGTAEYFSYLNKWEEYTTWFARCIVTINKTLPLGIFPVRKNDGSVFYPVMAGRRYATHLWKETALLAIQNGCTIEVRDGWGWRSFTKDMQLWAKWAYQKRLAAPDAITERLWKKSALAGIGSFGRSRDIFNLSAYDSSGSKSSPLFVGHVPVELYIVSDNDLSSALMGHWHRRLVAIANNSIREFAVPYAKRKELLLIDTDAIFVKGEEESRNYIDKYSLEAIGVPPGTWLSRVHHNFHIWRNRMWTSDEEPTRYGSLLERIRRCNTI